jgi:hypothetical protein
VPNQFEQLKQKYQPVLDAIQRESGVLLNVTPLSYSSKDNP